MKSNNLGVLNKLILSRYTNKSYTIPKEFSYMEDLSLEELKLWLGFYRKLAY